MLVYFLPMILFLGIMTSYQDIKIGKIRNKWIILALVYAILVNVASIIYYLSVGSIQLSYVSELLSNFMFAVLVGFGLWYFNVWTAGDGKLFIAYAALLPLSVYSSGYYKWVPSLTLLINIFIPALVIVIVFMLFKVKLGTIKKKFILFVIEFFEPKKFLNSVVILFVVFWVVNSVLSLINFNNYILSLVITMLTFSAISKQLTGIVFYLMILALVIRLVIDKTIYSVSFLINFAILIIIFRCMNSLFEGEIGKIFQEVFSKETDVNKLKPGMILSEIITKIDKKELSDLNKQKMEIVKSDSIYYAKRSKSTFSSAGFIDEEAEGLTKKQIKKIKFFGFKRIRVSQTIPFAPLMFLGVILTIVANGNILILIKTIFQIGG